DGLNIRRMISKRGQKKLRKKINADNAFIFIFFMFPPFFFLVEKNLSLFQRYVNGTFIQEHRATIGADFMTKDISVDDKLIWDTAGQERFQSLGSAFYKGSDACVLVYDVTNDQSFNQIETWKKNFLDQAGPENGENFPFLLCGNKCDLQSSRAVQQEEGEKLAKQNNMPFFETSALDGHNVEAAIRTIASIASEFET
ncbi:hypothetical protein RFI_04907, partial [Reticulomyxa filosa]